MEDNTFDPDLIHAIFKLVWTRRALEREKNEGADAFGCEVGGGTSKKPKSTSSANGNALKLSCELLRIFITEAVQRAATIAEAEGVSKIEATHLERILPQLLLDF
ncbi:protein MHF2 homolog [Ziziphus jujuba]|uniref:Protein MHF2 homolog n=1 Tax=Ziziphus jujuba TaxID=326968 RepID=A0A6P3ZSD7_ZIZJJ|nr:protein MHF2 homolog [Ziziphus jujuba]XP_048329576.1 protein MHF2 homolog [Ziziphus jujuba var. spinosa]